MLPTPRQAAPLGMRTRQRRQSSLENNILPVGQHMCLLGAWLVWVSSSEFRSLCIWRHSLPLYLSASTHHQLISTWLSRKFPTLNPFPSQPLICLYLLTLQFFYWTGTENLRRNKKDKWNIITTQNPLKNSNYLMALKNHYMDIKNNV